MRIRYLITILTLGLMALTVAGLGDSFGPPGIVPDNAEQISVQAPMMVVPEKTQVKKIFNTSGSEGEAILLADGAVLTIPPELTGKFKSLKVGDTLSLSSLDPNG